ncbi:MAG: hypothetical protein NT049_05300 [Planctomycetota bacterium]|nr:hypothetical protein [Planctomycetota bacterium]
MKTLLVVSVVLAMGAAVCYAEDMVDNPAYKLWASFKAGAMVKSEMNTTAGEMKTQIEQTQTLKEVTPEKAVVEIKMTMLMSGNKTEMPANSIEIPAKIEKGKLAAKPDAEVKEGAEAIEVAGKKLQCKWTETKMKQGEMTIMSKVWTAAEIPGSVAKMESKTEGTVKSETTMKIVEYKTGG